MHEGRVLNVASVVSALVLSRSLTLIENAVRHGIDASEEGERIDVGIARRGERCVFARTTLASDFINRRTVWGPA